MEYDKFNVSTIEFNGDEYIKVSDLIEWVGINQKNKPEYTEALQFIRKALVKLKNSDGCVNESFRVLQKKHSKPCSQSNWQKYIKRFFGG